MMRTRSLLLGAAVMAVPLGAAMAQQGSTNGTQPYATPPTYNSAPRTAPNSPQMNDTSASTDPRVPGATGQTVVPGSGSSMAGSNRQVPNPNSNASSAGAGMGGK